MKLKDLVKQSGGSGSDVWNIPVELLHPDPDNLRIDTQELRDHIASLAESIQEQGFLRTRPLTVRQDGDRLIVEDGNCRLLAVRIAMERGVEIKTLPCLSEAPNTKPANRLLNKLIANSGKAHMPAEYAEAIEKFRSYGWTDADIARKLGKSRAWITNTLDTVALPDDVQALIADGTVKATLARQVVREAGVGAAEKIVAAKAETGRAHVTARHLKAPEPPVEAPPINDAPKATVADLRAAALSVLKIWDAGGHLGTEWDRALADLRGAVS